MSLSRVNEKKIWLNLLSCKRQSEILSGKLEIKCKIEPRNHFERDCDRITYSYPFRRLQDKTQVIPLPEVDFVHTRLTHSLEVATVGRSLGRLLETELLDKKIIDQSKKGDIPSIVTAACLAHDIGNPPFGHSGENSISEYFKFGDGLNLLTPEYGGETFSINSKEINEPNYKNVLSRIKCTDIKQFEGNANGFRILSRINGIGLNLTAATLGAFTKYPRTSYVLGDTVKKRWSNRVSQKKYGFFYTEKEIFSNMAKHLGLNVLYEDEFSFACSRHPLAFLMEAADDICYRIIDLEDGHRIGKIPFKIAENPLKIIASRDERFNSIEYSKQKDEKLKITYLRSKCINYLIFQVFQSFKNNYDNIISGVFDSELLANIEDKVALRAAKKLKNIVATYLYNWDRVLSIEATGFEVLSGLVKEFITASNICIDCDPITISHRASKIYQLLPDQFKHLNDEEEIYERYIKVIDYIAGMTDSYALNLFRRIKGIQI